MPKVGDKIRITSDNSGHHYEIGRELVITIINKYGYSPDGGEFYLIQDEFEIIPDIFSLESLEKDENRLMSDLNTEKFIFNFLEKNDLSECRYNDVFVEYMIQLFESNDPNKRTELVKIINTMNNSFVMEKLNNNNNEGINIIDEPVLRAFRIPAGEEPAGEQQL
jgi:hypothetical protein